MLSSFALSLSELLLLLLLRLCHLSARVILCCTWELHLRHHWLLLWIHLLASRAVLSHGHEGLRLALVCLTHLRLCLKRGDPGLSLSFFECKLRLMLLLLSHVLSRGHPRRHHWSLHAHDWLLGSARIYGLLAHTHAHNWLLLWLLHQVLWLWLLLLVHT